jgi:hypothetical protein
MANVVISSPAKISRTTSNVTAFTHGISYWMISNALYTKHQLTRQFGEQSWLTKRAGPKNNFEQLSRVEYRTLTNV